MEVLEMGKTPEYTKRAAKKYRDKFDILQVRLDKGTKERIRSITISTHAPTRGATLSTGNLLLWMENFNPRSHEGSDHVCVIWKIWNVVNFNPRSHEGSDSNF